MEIVGVIIAVIIVSFLSYLCSSFRGKRNTQEILNTFTSSEEKLKQAEYYLSNGENDKAVEACVEALEFPEVALDIYGISFDAGVITSTMDRIDDKTALLKRLKNHNLQTIDVACQAHSAKGRKNDNESLEKIINAAIQASINLFKMQTLTFYIAYKCSPSFPNVAKEMNEDIIQYFAQRKEELSALLEYIPDCVRNGDVKSHISNLIKSWMLEDYDGSLCRAKDMVAHHLKEKH